MAESPAPPRLTRRATLLGGAAALATAVGTVCTSEAAHAASSPGSYIYRSEVISRAWNWYDRGIQYSQSGHALDYERGHYYRTDCSGFVSQCWHTAKYGMGAPTTWTLPSLCAKISKSYLRPGDMLDWPYNHCVLFRKWANSDHTRLVIYELANESQDMNLRETSLSEFSSYGAYRYDRIR